MENYLLIDKPFSNIFFQFIASLFSFLTVYFEDQLFFNRMEFIFSLMYLN